MCEPEERNWEDYACPPKSYRKIHPHYSLHGTITQLRRTEFGGVAVAGLIAITTRTRDCSAVKEVAFLNDANARQRDESNSVAPWTLL